MLNLQTYEASLKVKTFRFLALMGPNQRIISSAQFMTVLLGHNTRILVVLSSL